MIVRASAFGDGRAAHQAAAKGARLRLKQKAQQATAAYSTARKALLPVSPAHFTFTLVNAPQQPHEM